MNSKFLLRMICILGMACLTSAASFAANTVTFNQQHGAVSWVELMTSDVDAATKFYIQLFGWATTESQMKDGATYVTINVNAKPVGGMMKIPPTAQGVPPYWGLYVTVNDVDAAAKQVQAAGGKILMPPTEIPDLNSRFCVVQDPQGAVLSLITYRQKDQATASNAEVPDASKQQGAISWFELETTDVDAAIKFYAPLLGWETEETPMADGTKYVMIKMDGKVVGGMMKTPPQAQGVPPYWGLYVTVNDIEATAKKVQELGGKILVTPMAIPDAASRFCVIQDPQGAVISLITDQQKEK